MKQWQQACWHQAQLACKAGATVRPRSWLTHHYIHKSSVTKGDSEASLMAYSSLYA